MNLFEVTKRASRPNYSMLTPAAADAKRGVAYQESATANTAELADGTSLIIGFVTRDILITGPVLGDVIYPGRIQLPFTAGEEGSFEYAEEVEAEGSDYVDAGITSGAALKTPLMFASGKFALATTGKYAEFELVALPTPEVAGNVRIKARRLSAWIKP